MSFVDRVACRIELTIGSDTVAVEPRRVDRFAVALRPWGYTAEVVFRVELGASTDVDEVIEPFGRPDVATVTASIARAFDEEGETTVPLALAGVVVERDVSETAADAVAGAPVLTRRYRVRFTDRAQAWWSRHRPTALLVDGSYADLLAAHVPRGLTLRHDWAASSVKRPVLALGLGVDDGGTAEGAQQAGGAHFLDFVCWLADREGVGLFADPATDTLTIAAAKPGASADPVALEPVEVARVAVTMPPVRRTRVSVLNSHAEGVGRKEIAEPRALDGLRSVHVMRSAIASDLDRRAALETARAGQPMPGLQIELARLPAELPAVNRGLSLGDGFSPALFTHGKTFRTTALDLAGEAVGDEGGVDAAAGRRFTLTARVRAEQAADPVMRLPPFARPAWPLRLEGRVVSAVGADPEETYESVQDGATSQDLYRVEVPVFAGQKVVVSFEPVMLGGQFYFPAYKGERVLLSLDFDRADFATYLDWRPGGRLPLDGQGNHLLMGKKAASQTSISHVYTDAKPVLRIQRTQGPDQQTIVIEDGTILMTTLENE